MKERIMKRIGKAMKHKASQHIVLSGPGFKNGFSIKTDDDQWWVCVIIIEGVEQMMLLEKTEHTLAEARDKTFAEYNRILSSSVVSKETEKNIGIPKTPKKGCCGGGKK